MRPTRRITDLKSARSIQRNAKVAVEALTAEQRTRLADLLKTDRDWGRERREWER